MWAVTGFVEFFYSAIAILGFISLSGELGGPGKRSRALGTVSSGPPPRPGACQLRQRTGVFLCLLACLCARGRAAQRDLPLSGQEGSGRGGFQNTKN